MASKNMQSRESRTVNCYREFAKIPSDSLDLLRCRNAGCFFFSIEWFSCLAQFGVNERFGVRIYDCLADNRDERSSYLLCLFEDVWRKRLTSLSNYYTIKYPGAIGPDEVPEFALGAIVDQIASELPAWSEVEIRYLSANNPETSALHDALTGAGYRVDLFHQHWNWFINVDGLSFADYLARRPTRLRNTLRRKALRVAKRHRVRFAEFRCGDDLASGLMDYHRVYERSWKQPERRPDFVPELILLCAKHGVLRLGMLYLDEAPVATQFWICSDGVSYIYKLAQDPNYNDLSVGALLTAHMFEQAIDVDKVSEIDFGVGDEAFKQDWTDARRQFVGLQALNRRTLRGCLLSLRLNIRDLLRGAGLRKYTPVQAVSEHVSEAKVG